MSFANRLQSFVNFKKLKPTQIANVMVDLTDSTDPANDLASLSRRITKYLKGTHLPNSEFLVKLLKSYPELNGDWLITGRGEMFLDDKSNEDFSYHYSSKFISAKRLDDEFESLWNQIGQIKDELNNLKQKS